MPLYVYRCAMCGHEFEEIQKFTDAPIEDCPACGEATAFRTITGTNFSLKGGGWYKDLYASPKKEKKSDARD